eukprot:2257806-Pleurochrysis_carterae.AAC.1
MSRGAGTPLTGQGQPRTRPRAGTRVGTAGEDDPAPPQGSLHALLSGGFGDDRDKRGGGEGRRGERRGDRRGDPHDDKHGGGRRDRREEARDDRRGGDRDDRQHPGR